MLAVSFVVAAGVQAAGAEPPEDAAPLRPSRFRRVWTFVSMRDDEEFARGELAAANNAMHDAIKARNPSIVTGAHLYPVFLPEPLYGHRLKFDIIGETCAWYLKWPDDKIRAYAANCLTNRPADSPRSRRVPFIAVTRGNWCENKTAADIERELNDLLDAGADEIMAFEMNAIIDDPELYSVFLKYCGSGMPPR